MIFPDEQEGRPRKTFVEARLERVRSRLQSPVAILNLLIALAGLAVALRNVALNHPYVSSDEGIYTVHAKYLGHANLLKGNALLPKEIPGSLFFAAIHWVFRLGDNYAVGARLMNVAWLCLALLLIYLTSRLLMRTPWALLVTLLIASGPATIYAACVMPETMYLFMISGMFFVYVRFISSRPLMAAGLTGAALGAASLVKAHALLLVLPVIVAVVILKASIPEWASWRICAFQILLVLLGLVAAHSALGYAISGRAEPYVGAFYQAHVLQSPAPLSWRLLLNILGGHVAVLFSIYAAPLAVIATGLLPRTRIGEPLPSRVRLQGLLLLLICCLATLLFTTSVFTIAIVNRDVFGKTNRLHGRYYFFLLPFLVVSFFAVVDRLDWNQRRVRAIFAAACGTAIFLALVSLLQFDRRYFTFFVDYPEAFWFLDKDVPFVPLLCTSIPLLVYTARRKCRPAWFAYGYLLLSLTGTWQISRYILAMPPSPADQFASWFRSNVPQADWDSGLVISTQSNSDDVFRFLFHIPAAYHVIRDLSSPSVPAQQVAGNYSWVLVASGRPVEFAYVQSFAGGPFDLYLRQPNFHLNVQSPGQPLLSTTSGNRCQVSRLVGFHDRESWGVWSSQDPAEIELQQPVSGKVHLRLVVYGLPQNPSRNLQVSIGASVQSIVLPTSATSFELNYDLPVSSRSIVFRGVTPRSPQSLRMSADPRLLGVGLVELGCTQDGS